MATSHDLKTQLGETNALIELRPEAPATDKPVQPKPPEPAKTANEHERRVQQKPKRRIYSHDR